MNTSVTSTQTFCFIPFKARGYEFWVFRFWVSRHRLDLLLELPRMTWGHAFAAEVPGGIDITGGAKGA
jgi:hypothetical protein